MRLENMIILKYRNYYFKIIISIYTDIRKILNIFNAFQKIFFSKDHSKMSKYHSIENLSIFNIYQNEHSMLFFS